MISELESLAKIPYPFAPYKPANQAHNLVGLQFGRLLVFSIHSRSPENNTARWLCRCDCGNWVAVLAGNLQQGSVQSCGCLAVDSTRERASRHGRSYSPEYKVYGSAKQRCQTPTDPGYKNYGGRGIEFRFSSFEQFYEVLGPRPTDKHSLDRIDVNGHYEPGNVRWATRKQQGRNQRTNHTLTANGVTKTMSEWSEDNGWRRSLIMKRLRAGWCDECSVTIPKQSGRPSQTCSHRGEEIIDFSKPIIRPTEIPIHEEMQKVCKCGHDRYRHWDATDDCDLCRREPNRCLSFEEQP